MLRFGLNKILLNTATLFYENALHQASKVSDVC